MGIYNEAIVAVGHVFDTEDDIIHFVMSHTQNSLTNQDLEELHNDVYHYFNTRSNQIYPIMDCLNLCIDNSGYYIGYNVIDKNPQKMIENIQKYTQLWKNLFKTEPAIITEVHVG